MLKKFLPVFFTFLSFLAVPNNIAKAINEEFLIDLNISYKYNQEGYFEVEKNFGIINLQNDLAITSFTQNLEEYNYYDLEARDVNGPLEFKEIDEEDNKKVTVSLRGVKIGKNQINKFTIKYKSRDLIQRNGNILNINLPKIPKNNIQNLKINLIIPENSGKIIYVSPNPTKQEIKNQNYNFEFEGETILDKAISATFGEYQLTNFNIKYDLKNDSKWFQTQEIALVPDINKRQEVRIESLEPKPLDLYEDEDGNYLAKYRLNPSSNLEVTLKGSVRTYGIQIDPEKGGVFENINKELIKKYTKEDRYWETNSGEIKEIAQRLKDSDKNVSLNAQKVYKFLIENYKYDFEILKKASIERYGALTTIKREAKIGCMEFTDAFIAISRSMGIPAREINGYAYSKDPEKNPINISINEGDRLHAWPEFYDPNFGWVQIDPTWGNTSNIDYFTKLDLNHISLVVKGVDSTYPLPAGFYKNDSNKKYLEFDFPDNPETLAYTKDYSAQKVFSFNFVSLLQGVEPIKITNKGNSTLFNINSERVLPGQSKVIFVKKGEATSFEDFGGNKNEIKVLNPFSTSILITIYIFFLGLLLYVILYVLVTQAKYLRKFFDHRFFRLLGRGRR
jgi:transglutaminase-like putative cysteine protease